MNEPAADDSLPFTGERLVTSCQRPLVYEHLHRYAIACAMAKGKRVLDIACGEGYGANLLAQTAANVVGVDIDAPTIAHAERRYQHRNLQFLTGSGTEIPCPDHSFDLVASFETIEHLPDHAPFLEELKRVLAPGGLLIISSPDKAEYRRQSGKANPFHYGELPHDGFVALMQKTFRHCIAARQRLVVGSWIAADAPSDHVQSASFHGGFQGIDVENGVHHGVYSFAICSDDDLPGIPLGVFEDPAITADTWNLLDSPATPRQLQSELRRLRQVDEPRGTQEAELQHQLQEASAQLAKLRAEFEDKSRHTGILQGEVAEKSRQVAHYRQESETHARRVDRLSLELQRSEDRATQERDDLIDARWEVLTLRAKIIRQETDTAAGTAIDLQNRAESAESERNQLRELLKRLQGELETERSNRQAKESRLKAVTKELRTYQERLLRIRKSFSHKLIRPFSRSHRRLEQLKLSTRADD